MNSERPRSLPRRALSAIGRGLTFVRNTFLNVLALSVVVGLLAALFAGGPKVEKGSALVLVPKGNIVEQLTAKSPSDLVENLAGGGTEETLLKDLVDALAAAKTDERISSVYLDLDEMGGAGMTVLEDVAAALADFRSSGKKVVVAGDLFDMRRYYLAAQGDELLLHPEGMVLIEGFGRYRSYYKDAIDRLGVTWNVFRVGEYKSAVEPYLRNDMSPEAKEADLEWMGDLWRAYVAAVAKARKTTPEAIVALVDQLPERLKAAGGNPAKLALDAKLVDRLATRDEVRKRMIELAGEDAKSKSFRQVALGDYLEALGSDRPGAKAKGDAVAVVVAKGEIVDGTAGPGRVGGDSTAALIRKARQDEKVKAIVLRVDSPGGSAFASEVIRRELELAREGKKPVIVSMGSVAASGGYWISTSSDEIWASPETITGSIGIFGMFPTIEKPLAKYLGVHVDGVGTTPWAGIRIDRELPPEVGGAIQAMIDNGYEEFLARVGRARKMTRDQVDKIARGRVWSGADAKEIGLVDHLGGLGKAIESAAAKAKLGKTYRVTYVEKEKSLKEKLLSSFSVRATRLAAAFGYTLAPAAETADGPGAALLGAVAAEVDQLSVWNDPRGVYAHCLCEVK
ncbi:MAG TPA: signal peptide peptidase SppA [Thermoanaerobaculia bacterium]|nr:signal peptide peptidase SppA [Thermoanaerobaculia bacterium]